MGATANIIKDRRDAAGLTQAQLAEALRLDVMTVSRWERGLFRPTVSHRVALAAVLGGVADDYREERS